MASAFDDAINEALNSGDPKKVLEGIVANGIIQAGFELISFNKEVGLNGSIGEIYDGRLSEGNLHVWIALDNSELKNFDANEIEVIAQKLGSIPKTHILLDVSKELGSEQIALEFACKFATQWHCVIYDSNQQVYFPNQLFVLKRALTNNFQRTGSISIQQRCD